MKSFKYYKSKIYDSQKPYGKVMFWLAVFAIFITILIEIFFGGSKQIVNIDSNNNVIIENSSLINSPIFQESSNISVTYNSPSDNDMFTPFYSQTLYINKDHLINGEKYNFYFMKIILPDDQEAFIPELLFNKSYSIANCNEELTDCYVHHKYRIKEGLKEEDICWVFTTRFGHNHINTDTQDPKERFYNNPADCSKIVQD